MEIFLAGLFVLVIFLFVIYDYLEITALKYGILRAIATQSKEVDRALEKLIAAKDDYKILNKEFKKIERIYLTSLNSYLIQLPDADSFTLRNIILRKDNFKL
jgi:hypothetical protein